MFKVSHELPVNLLYKSFDWNDYEYCLPHLLDQNEDYLDHFLALANVAVLSCQTSGTINSSGSKWLIQCSNLSVSYASPNS